MSIESFKRTAATVLGFCLSIAPIVAVCVCAWYTIDASIELYRTHQEIIKARRESAQRWEEYGRNMKQFGEAMKEYGKTMRDYGKSNVGDSAKPWGRRNTQALPALPDLRKATWCTDCKATLPCSGGGTGAVAEPAPDGVWNCLGPTSIKSGR